MKPKSALSDPSQSSQIPPRPPAKKGRQNLIAGALVGAAIAVFMVYDYLGQQGRIETVERRIEMIDERLDQTTGEPTALFALRNLLVSTRDEATTMPRRWIGPRQDAAWDYLDRVEAKLKTTEQRFGVSSE